NSLSALGGGEGWGEVGDQTAAADPAVRAARTGRGVLAIARRSAVSVHVASAPASGHAGRWAGADCRRMVAAGGVQRGRCDPRLLPGRGRRGTALLAVPSGFSRRRSRAALVCPW